MFAETLLIRQPREKMPRFIMAVFMENHPAACAQGVAQLSDQQAGIIHK
jgi:hypothetical protein